MPPREDDSVAHETAPPALSVEELRLRVREVERLAALGCRLAREALSDPVQSARLQERLASILREVGELVPGSTWEAPDVDPLSRRAPSVTPAADADDVARGEPDSDEGDATDEDEETEWELDPEKLALALDNESLMSQIPEGDRVWLRATARRAIEAHARGLLATRVKDALEMLYETMDQCHEEAKKRLSVALTVEQARSQKAGRKPD